MCGNGIIDSGEECDSASAACVACRLIVPVCGDGITNSDEQCDDANDFDNDGCDRLCRIRKCGDDIVQDGEHCDPPGGACRSDCTLLPPNCGDGIVQANEREVCDDGNLAIGDGCHDCDVERGNGDSTCRPLPLCVFTSQVAESGISSIAPTLDCSQSKRMGMAPRARCWSCSTMGRPAASPKPAARKPACR